MNKQGKGKIEYLDYTWNPVTGCYHGCYYCFAEKIAKRFGHNTINEACMFRKKPKIYQLDYPCTYDRDCGWDSMGNPIVKDFIDPYPAGFSPTFHRYRLNEPQKKKEPSIIGVVYMGDLFGDWVPDGQIREVFKACEAAPRHTYLFLTKNGARYEQLGLLPENDNFWYGTTRTGINPNLECGSADHGKTFLSLEPLLAPMDADMLNAIDMWDWVIVGQQTGPGAKPPEDEWVQSIIDQCRAAGVPIFIKSPLYKRFPIQEWPEGLQTEK